MTIIYYLLIILSFPSTIFCNQPAKKNISDSTEKSLPINITGNKEIPKPRPITIKNDITPESTTYKHWSGSYTPSTFIVSANGIKIDSEKAENIIVTDDALTVRYDYNFKMRKGAQETSFTVNDNTDNLIITFSWDNDWHIIIDGATAQEKKKVSFEG